MAEDFRVLSTEERFSIPLFGFVTDTVEMPGVREAKRSYIAHHVGAVAIAAYQDGKVLLIHQYRHPVRRPLWELPAGLLDNPAETPWETAQRELFEEADATAEQWNVMADLVPSPAISDELLRIYVARHVAEVPHAERYVRTEEEAHLTYRWVDVDEAVHWVLDGTIENGPSAVGVLALARLTATNWKGLRPADAPWPARDH